MHGKQQFEAKCATNQVVQRPVELVRQLSAELEGMKLRALQHRAEQNGLSSQKHFAPRSVRRPLLMPQVSPGSLYMSD